LEALSDAYLTFGSLTTYDAGQATAHAIKTAFGKINILTGLLNLLLPSGVVIPQITVTITDVLGGLGTFSGDRRQT
jgi:hypothetical protein